MVELAIQAGHLPPVTAPVQVLGEWSPERSPTKMVLLSPSVTLAALSAAVAIKQAVARPARKPPARPSDPLPSPAPPALQKHSSQPLQPT